MDQRFAYTIPEASKLIALGRSTIYKEISAGRLRARKLGNRTLILAVDLTEFLSGLPAFNLQDQMRQFDNDR